MCIQGAEDVVVERTLIWEIGGKILERKHLSTCEYPVP